MSSYKINVEKAKGKKLSSGFSEEEKEALFTFLEKNCDDKEALEFALDWFNCSRITLMVLEFER